MDFKSYYAIASSLLIFSVILNSYGIRLFCKRRRGLTSQGTILVNLSLTEITGAAVWLLRDTVLLISQDVTALKAFGILMIILINVRMIWYISMFSILIDRFFACNFPLKHMTLITKSKIKICLGITWTIFLLSAVVFSVIDVKYFKLVFTRELFMALAGLFVLIFFTTYGTIFFKLIRARSSHSQNRQRNQNSQFIRVTGLILATFFIFEIVPSVIGYVNKGPLPSSDFLHATALLTDPIIYILFQRDLRSALAKSLRIASKEKAPRGETAMTGSKSSSKSPQTKYRSKPEAAQSATNLKSPKIGYDNQCTLPPASMPSNLESGIFDVDHSLTMASPITEKGMTSAYDIKDEKIKEKNGREPKLIDQLAEKLETVVQMNNVRSNDACGTPLILDGKYSPFSPRLPASSRLDAGDICLEPTFKDSVTGNDACGAPFVIDSNYSSFSPYLANSRLYTEDLFLQKAIREDATVCHACGCSTPPLSRIGRNFNQHPTLVPNESGLSDRNLLRFDSLEVADPVLQSIQFDGKERQCILLSQTEISPSSLCSSPVFRLRFRSNTQETTVSQIESEDMEVEQKCDTKL